MLDLKIATDNVARFSEEFSKVNFLNWSFISLPLQLQQENERQLDALQRKTAEVIQMKQELEQTKQAMKDWRMVMRRSACNVDDSFRS